MNNSQQNSDLVPKIVQNGNKSTKNNTPTELVNRKVLLHEKKRLSSFGFSRGNKKLDFVNFLIMEISN